MTPEEMKENEENKTRQEQDKQGKNETPLESQEPNKNASKNASENASENSSENGSGKNNGDKNMDGKETKNAPKSSDAPEKSQKDGGFISFTREQVEKMEAAAKELDEAQKQIETMKDQYLRLAAEYDNYRKRTAREKDALYQDAKADTIREFLAVYDNLERASKTEGDDESPHKQGLIKIFNQSREILKKLNVKEIDALGQVFDPEKHNAVMHIDDENLGENVISQVFQDGFTLGDKIIRHATVQVAN